MCVFGGCESDKSKTMDYELPSYNLYPYPTKRLTQADVDRIEPKPLTRWQRFWAWWRK